MITRLIAVSPKSVSRPTIFSGVAEAYQSIEWNKWYKIWKWSAGRSSNKLYM